MVSPSLDTLNRLLEAMGETLTVVPVSLNGPIPDGGNQPIADLRADYRELSADERLSQAALLSEVATELASGAEA